MGHKPQAWSTTPSIHWNHSDKHQNGNLAKNSHWKIHSGTNSCHKPTTDSSYVKNLSQDEWKNKSPTNNFFVDIGVLKMSPLLSSCSADVL